MSMRWFGGKTVPLRLTILLWIKYDHSNVSLYLIFLTIEFATWCMTAHREDITPGEHHQCGCCMAMSHWGHHIQWGALPPGGTLLVGRVSLHESRWFPAPGGNLAALPNLSQARWWLLHDSATAFEVKALLTQLQQKPEVSWACIMDQNYPVTCNLCGAWFWIYVLLPYVWKTCNLFHWTA